MEFELDFSQLNLASHPDKVTPNEIKSVIENTKRPRLSEINGYPKEMFYNIECGYSNKKHILLIVSRIYEMKRQILQVKVADEEEIEFYYCKG